MKVSILKESKKDILGREVENRVILIPPLIKEIAGKCPEAEIWVESGAGEKTDFKDDDYLKAGAKKTVDHGEALCADLIFGVKETKTEDFNKLKGNIFMSFQHFAEPFGRSSF